MKYGRLTQFSMALALAAATAGCSIFGTGPAEYSVVVYGGTPSGIAAAVAAARLGEKVCLVAQNERLGGLLASGVSDVDGEAAEYIGGISREVLRNVAAFYRDTYGEASPQFAACHGGMRFEPQVAGQVFEALVAGEDITVRRGWRVIGVEAGHDRIFALVLENPATGDSARVGGEFFIDASYAGDLLDEAGAPFSAGREGRAAFAEILAGRLWQDPDTGTPLPASTHEGDSLIQAYNWRFCLTDSLENSVPWPEPEGYDPGDYRILYDFISRHGAAACRDLLRFTPLPNRKFDVDENPDCWLSADLVGSSQGYPQGTWQEREAIEKAHLEHLLGLWKFLRTDPGLPESLRVQFDRYRPAADEFTGAGNLPFQLNVREGRRLHGEYIFTERDATLDTLKEESIGLGRCPLNSHATGPLRPPYPWREGYFVLSARPYQIPYRVMVPTWIRNLLVSVCVSASHVACGSLRYEPVLMILGQAAGTAASLCLDYNCEAREVPVGELSQRLQADGAILAVNQARPWQE